MRRPLRDGVRRHDPRWDAGDERDAGDVHRDGSLWTDGGEVDPADAGVADGGGGTRPDGGVVRPDDAGPGDAGSTDFCTPVDCDGDGTLEYLYDDPDHCGVCDRSCGLLRCCNGECVTGSMCALVC